MEQWVTQVMMRSLLATSCNLVPQGSLEHEYTAELILRWDPRDPAFCTFMSASQSSAGLGRIREFGVGQRASLLFVCVCAQLLSHF